MNITLLGTGMQGRAALFDLARSERVRSITAADRDVDGLRAFVREKKLSKVSCERVDASDPADVRRVVRPGTDGGMKKMNICMNEHNRPKLSAAKNVKPD